MEELRYPADAVAIGAGFGNEACYVRTTPAAGIDHLYVAATGRWYFGRAALRLCEGPTPLRQIATVFQPAALCAVNESKELVAEVMVFVPPGYEARAYLLVRLRNESASRRSVAIE